MGSLTSLTRAGSAIPPSAVRFPLDPQPPTPAHSRRRGERLYSQPLHPTERDEMSFVPEDGTLYNPVEGSPNLYTGQIEWTAFNYRVSVAVCAVFVALFSISLILHMAQAVRSRYWFLIYTLGFAALTETLGWSFRLWAAISFRWEALRGGIWSFNDISFLEQISTLIIAPAFSTAGNYFILGVLVSLLGGRYCRLPARTYTIMFIVGDILSLVIQAIGGGAASAADTLDGANNGAKIVVGGVIVQMVVMVAYSLLLLEFTIRYFTNRPLPNGPWRLFSWVPSCRRRKRDVQSSPASSEVTQVGADGSTTVERGSKEERRATWMLAALAGSTILIFIRSIFRTAELLDGWEGSLATNQVLFTVLDGAMIALSSLLLNIFHPVWLLRRPVRRTKRGSVGFQGTKETSGDTLATGVPR